MNLQKITALPSFQSLAEELRAGDSPAPMSLSRAARLPILAALHAELQAPFLLLTHRTDRALSLADELERWSPEASRLLFPEPNPLFYEDAPWGENTRRDRLTVLTTFAAHHIPGAHVQDSSPLVIAPIRAIMARTLPRRDFLKESATLKVGQVVQPDTLARKWVGQGYDPVTTVVAPGQFARRGGILDVWPSAGKLPTRIEFFGDEIETLRYFEASTQRTVGNHERLLITPAREYTTHRADEIGVPVKDLFEFHIPLLHLYPASLLDYLPAGALVFIDDWEAIQETVAELEEQATGLRQEHVETGALPDDFPIPYLTLSEIQDSLSQNQVIELGPVTAPENSPLAQAFTPGPRFGGQLKPFMDHIVHRHSRGEDILIVSRQAGRLQELWNERPVVESVGAQPDFVPGSLAEGWILTPPEGQRLHLLTDGEIFGWRRPEPRQRHRIVPESPEMVFADFRVDGWIVHVDHGVGRYQGLVSRAIEGVEQEYLCVEYAEGDQLYVPVHQADRLTNYLGPDGRSPSLSRLGGAGWALVKSRVKEAVRQVAEDLLELYARRQVAVGFAFNPDSQWQGELEASFPYIETEDQLQVIREVKRDMESDRPMDRLICGDVGYGKTEVALRAAFKAVMSGKQVAILVPTTLLAQQHYQTFLQRLAAFPAEVEMLSRFRTPKQQSDILFRLATGALDIVIGTHRLIQPDIQFKDLGLVIIDEEQRFGVTHKETLKRMRTEVDVLTMTATPIPRTLYMAMTGVRDISTINTPPEERLPVITHVGVYSPTLIRQSILRELERGGQVFLVHNRVQTIGSMHNQIRRLVPEARLGIAHGQMKEKELSQRMNDFRSGEIDVLITTSIIESGLDIPSANTLIVDRADTFGLAQLYQLRGRVGRGAQRAYAYFFRHNRITPTEEGRQRLETIAEHTHLGAGYSIAMRDLEIRGAGDILGVRQHGNIAAVGFHLYTRLLSQSVELLREDKNIPLPRLPAAFDQRHSQVNVDLPLPTSIPPEYVPDQSQRLHLYRRLANMNDIAEVETLAEEFADRFGPAPESVLNLIYQIKIKLIADAAGLISVTAEGGQIALRFPQLTESAPSRQFANLGSDSRTSKNTIWLNIRQNPQWPQRLVELLENLKDQVQ